jgi:hypothetical protein
MNIWISCNKNGTENVISFVPNEALKFKTEYPYSNMYLQRFEALTAVVSPIFCNIKHCSLFNSKLQARPLVREGATK